MEIPACEPQHDLQTSSSELYTSTSSRDDVECPQNGQTLTADDPVLVTFRRTDLDDLPCWIGCIQLDHPYDSHMSLSSTDNFPTTTEPPVDYHHEVAAKTGTKEDISSDQNVDPQCWHQLTDVKNCWVGLLDHAYESSSWDSGSTGDRGRWDHAYNIQCSADESSSSIGRSVSGQHLDHSYDSRMSSELSYSETVLSSFLDHAYFASDWVVTSGRRCTSGQRWSSTDDLRTVGRATAAFLWWFTNTVSFKSFVLDLCIWSEKLLSILRNCCDSMTVIMNDRSIGKYASFCDSLHVICNHLICFAVSWPYYFIWSAVYYFCIFLQNKTSAVTDFNSKIHIFVSVFAAKPNPNLKFNQLFSGPKSTYFTNLMKYHL